MSESDVVTEPVGYVGPTTAPADVIRAQFKRLDTMIEEYYMTSQQLDAYAAYFEACANTVEEPSCAPTGAFVGFIESKTEAGVQVPLTIDALLLLCEQNAPASLQQLLCEAPDIAAKYKAMADFLVRAGIDDLCCWAIHGTVDLLMLRAATTVAAATEDALARFNPDTMTICCV
jgi:hypothetical protein